MKLSISNIGWTAEQDPQMYENMRRLGYTGLEIAPTRIFPENSYEKLGEAKSWADELRSRYGFTVPSMQSIWYGRTEQIFGTQDEFDALVDYTKKAIDFASAIHCKNLVFGCPRNRNIPQNGDPEVGIRFFKILGDYAASQGTVIGMEANPPIYNTNYVNDTASALALIRAVDSEGFKLNLDAGTMIHNEESTSLLTGNVHLINHVHISEPMLKPIEKRTLHRELEEILLAEDYQGFVSIEMGKTEGLAEVNAAMKYVTEVFRNHL